jgi:hypothetical protein
VHAFWEERCGTVCAIWGLYWHAPSTQRAYASPWPHVNGGVRQTHSLPRRIRRGTPAHLLRYDTRCQPKAVAQRLRTIAILMHFFEENLKRKWMISLSSPSIAVSVPLCKRAHSCSLSKSNRGGINHVSRSQVDFVGLHRRRHVAGVHSGM